MRALRASSALGPGVLSTFIVAFALLVSLSAALSKATPAAAVVVSIAISTGVAVGICLLARRFLLPKVSARATPWVVLGVYALAGLSRSLILAGLCAVFGLNIILLPPRVTTCAAILLMLLAAVTCNRVWEHRTKMAELAALKDELKELKESFGESVVKSNTEMTTEVRRYLDPAVRNLHDLLDRPGDTSGDTIAAAMVGVVSEVVRPLMTADLVRSAALDAPVKAREREPVENFRVRNTRVDVTRAIRPLLVLAFTLITLVYRPVRMPSASFNSAFVIMVLSSFIVLLAAQRLWPRRFRSLPMAGALMAIVALFLVSALIPGFLLELTTSATMAEAFPFVGASLSFWVMLGLTVAAPSLVEQFAEQSQTAAAEVNRQLELAQARLQRQLWINRRNLTWVLHGPIQSALLASAMALSQGGDDPGVRERVRKNLTAALAHLESNRMMHPNLREALEDLAAVWSTSCRVAWHIDPLATRLLNDDRDVVRCIAEIAREGVSNALRHGAARRVNIVISVPVEQRGEQRVEQRAEVIRVQITDDGSGLAPDGLPGLGSAMLDEITHTWSRVSEPVGFPDPFRTTLTASVPTALLLR